MSADSNRSFAESIVRRLRGAGHQALFAGGCVRDLLLGRTPNDYDVATDARPERVRELFGHKRTLAVGASFGVVVVLPPKADREAGVEPVEVATFRTEGPYLDGRRPERVEFASPEEDAKRRDFTINGMFLDPVEDRVLDFVGGEADLRSGILRAIGDPRERMTEDKLRLLRAVRIAATLGFRIDEATAAAVREMAPQLAVVSAERITQELRRMLVHPSRRRAVELCAECGLLEVIFPELNELLRHQERWRIVLETLEQLHEPSFELSLAGLLESRSHEVTEICHRLRLSNLETEKANWLSGAERRFADALNRLSSMKRLAAHPDRGELIDLVEAQWRAKDGPLDLVSAFREFLRDTPPEEIDPPLLLTGKDLIAGGLKPGPEFKRILDAVRDAQLDGAITARDEAVALARRLHDAGSTDTK